MNRDRLPTAQMEMRQRMTQDPPPLQTRCSIPTRWRYTLTVALRALIVNCHGSMNKAGCEAAVLCAVELGLDVSLVTKYTPLEKPEEATRG